MPEDQEPEYVSDAHRDIHTFAHSYIEDDDEREEFYNAFMERTGHTKASSWGPPEENEDDKPKGYKPRAKKTAPAGGRSGGSYFGKK